jgi:hypothetical protein
LSQSYYYYLKCLLSLKRHFTLFFEAHHSTRTNVWRGTIFTARSLVRYIGNKRRMISKIDKRHNEMREKMFA